MKNTLNIESCVFVSVSPGVYPDEHVMEAVDTFQFGIASEVLLLLFRHLFITLHDFEIFY